MNMLIIAATDMEVQPSAGKLKKQGAIMIRSGVGAPGSVYHITKAIQKYQPKLILQAGIAGCFDEKYPLAEVLVVAEDRFGDLGVVENKQWRSVFDLGLIRPHQKPFRQGRLKNPHQKLVTATGLEAVPAVTVNEISTNKSTIRLLTEQNIVLESMEGAALHYVALMEGIAFLQIRAVSNYVGVRDKSKWMLAGAIENLNKELLRVVECVGSHVW